MVSTRASTKRTADGATRGTLSTPLIFTAEAGYTSNNKAKSPIPNAKRRKIEHSDDEIHRVTSKRTNKSLVDRDDQDDLPQQSTGGRNEIEDNDLPSDQWYVDHIVDHRITNKGVEYKIRWRGYTEEDDTWEPECNISGDSVDEYNKGQDSGSDDDTPLVRPRGSRRSNAAVDSSSDDDRPLVRPRGSRRSVAAVDSSSDGEDANDEGNDGHRNDDLLQDNHAGHSCSHEDGSDAEFFPEKEAEDEGEDDEYDVEPEPDFGEDIIVEDGQLVNQNEDLVEDGTPDQTQPSAKKTKQSRQLSKDEPPAHLFEGAPDENAKRFQEWLKLFVYCLWTGIDVKAKEKGEDGKRKKWTMERMGMSPSFATSFYRQGPEVMYEQCIRLVPLVAQSVLGRPNLTVDDLLELPEIPAGLDLWGVYVDVHPEGLYVGSSCAVSKRLGGRSGIAGRVNRWLNESKSPAKKGRSGLHGPFIAREDVTPNFRALCLTKMTNCEEYVLLMETLMITFFNNIKHISSPEENVVVAKTTFNITVASARTTQLLVELRNYAECFSKQRLPDFNSIKLNKAWPINVRSRNHGLKLMHIEWVAEGNADVCSVCGVERPVGSAREASWAGVMEQARCGRCGRRRNRKMRVGLKNLAWNKKDHLIYLRDGGQDTCVLCDKRRPEDGKKVSDKDGKFIGFCEQSRCLRCYHLCHYWGKLDIPLTRDNIQKLRAFVAQKAGKPDYSAGHKRKKLEARQRAHDEAIAATGDASYKCNNSLCQIKVPTSLLTLEAGWGRATVDSEGKSVTRFFHGWGHETRCYICHLFRKRHKGLERDPADTGMNQTNPGIIWYHLWMEDPSNHALDVCGACGIQRPPPESPEFGQWKKRYIWARRVRCPQKACNKVPPEETRFGWMPA